MRKGTVISIIALLVSIVGLLVALIAYFKRRSCALCDDLDADREALCRTLAGLDYRYDPVYNQFV